MTSEPLKCLPWNKRQRKHWNSAINYSQYEISLKFIWYQAEQQQFAELVQKVENKIDEHLNLPAGLKIQWNFSYLLDLSRQNQILIQDYDHVINFKSQKNAIIAVTPNEKLGITRYINLWIKNMTIISDGEYLRFQSSKEWNANTAAISDSTDLIGIGENLSSHSLKAIFDYSKWKRWISRLFRIVFRICWFCKCIAVESSSSLCIEIIESTGCHQIPPNWYFM